MGMKMISVEAQSFMCGCGYDICIIASMTFANRTDLRFSIAIRTAHDSVSQSVSRSVGRLVGWLVGCRLPFSSRLYIYYSRWPWNESENRAATAPLPEVEARRYFYILYDDDAICKTSTTTSAYQQQQLSSRAFFFILI